MNSYDLTGKTAIITGGASGIGETAAKMFAANGANIAIWDMSGDAAASIVREIGGAAMACDVSDWGSVELARDMTLKTFGRIDILVNSAGITGPNTTVEDYEPEAWRQVLDVNLTGTFLTNKAVVPTMKDQRYGRIVNIASVAGKEGNPNASAYSASKAGVIGLTKSLGKELADFDIAVNCITPAAARTPIFDQMTEEHINYMLSKIPRNRFVETEEIAHLIAWLASDANSFTTGAVFDISGGRATY